MAKTNQVSLFGIVHNLPRVTENRDLAMVVIKVIAGNRNDGDSDKQNKSDYPLLMTKDTAIVCKIKDWQKNDFVHIKGVLTTKRVERVSDCENCHMENAIEGQVSYIEPIHVELIKHNLTDDEAAEALVRNIEVSNNIRVVGGLCDDPQKIVLKTSRIKNVCQYQIAIPRTYRVVGSTDDDKTDYPWVKSYGRNAADDLKRLKNGSVVLIDGRLQTRITKKKIKCQCGNEYVCKDSTLEIVPYETEYLRNYVTDEDLGETKIFEEAVV